ncbi:MAG: ABC transporter ATP-binding protein [Firmicutes bacterium]|nr:ABC transporter ATP-binding protein [Bacillota bacterium]
MFKVDRIAKSYGELKVFQDLSLDFPTGAITAILGPSGCGKTTILKILAGIVKPDQGTVYSTSEVGFLFQEPRLLPWLDVYGNMALVLEDKVPAAALDGRIKYYLQAVGLADYLRFFPRQLSGGMKQRVAMARAFSYPAELLLMDEPFKSLDLKTRYQLVSDFLGLWRQNPNTAVVVTHDVKEALRLGDRILVLSEKPARLMESFDNELPFESRMAGTEAFSLEQKITGLLLGDRQD